LMMSAIFGCSPGVYGITFLTFCSQAFIIYSPFTLFPAICRLSFLSCRLQALVSVRSSGSLRHAQ
jgi:hypothetical protein